jgi:hypothetical protein
MSAAGTSSRIAWDPIVTRAAEIVESYEIGVTLRQLFYRLVAEETLPNTQQAYKGLSRVTAKARREGTFPSLVDGTRGIERSMTFASPLEAQVWLQRVYRLDRTEGQEYALYVAIEKHALGALLRSWFDPFGIPVVAFGGYSSQTLADEVAFDADEDGREAVLLYATDFDPSGEDIGRDFVERADCFEEVVRVALTLEQVDEFGLPPLPGKATDSRAGGFIDRYGELMQVELDALPPEELRQQYEAAFAPYWDTSAYEAQLQREKLDRVELDPREAKP